MNVGEQPSYEISVSLEDLRFVGGSPFDLISLEDRRRISVGGPLES